MAFARRDERADPIAEAEAELMRAQLVLEEALVADPDLSIEVDPTENMLLFVAVRASADQALDAVQSLRDEYQALGVTVLSKDQIEATKAAVLIDIERLKGEITALDVAEPEAESPAISAQRSALEAEIEIVLVRRRSFRYGSRTPSFVPRRPSSSG